MFRPFDTLRHRVAEARSADSLFFASLLSEKTTEGVFGDAKAILDSAQIYTTAVTLWVFLSQVMSINPVLGNRSAEHFFLLLLHADRDPTFQLNCLKALNSKTAQWPESFPQLLEKRLQLVNPAVFAEKKEPTRSATPESTQPGEPIKGETKIGDTGSETK